MIATLAIQKNDAKVFSKYQPFFRDNISILYKAKKGLQSSAIFDFIRIAELPNETIEHAFNKSMKTFQNYKEKKTTLDSVTTEKLLRLFALYSKGVEVFGSVHDFSAWLARPAFGIGNQVPRELLDTMTGIELINDELVGIEYGDLA